MKLSTPWSNVNRFESCGMKNNQNPSACDWIELRKNISRRSYMSMCPSAPHTQWQRASHYSHIFWRNWMHKITIKSAHSITVRRAGRQTLNNARGNIWNHLFIRRRRVVMVMRRGELTHKRSESEILIFHALSSRRGGWTYKCKMSESRKQSAEAATREFLARTKTRKRAALFDTNLLVSIQNNTT